MKTYLIAALLALSLSVPASAAELVFGAGVGLRDRGGDDVGVGFVEIHSDPLATYSWGSLAAMAVVQRDDRSDTFTGAGISAKWDLAGPWFVEGALAAGYYDAGAQGRDLGGNIQFRTLVGVGYELSDRTRISIAIDHLSNGSLNRRNPGRETVLVRYGVSF